MAKPLPFGVISVDPNFEIQDVQEAAPMPEQDIVERLREPIISDAFAEKLIVSGLLAERLINERRDAGKEIERLRAERDRYRKALDGIANAPLGLERLALQEQARAAIITDPK